MSAKDMSSGSTPAAHDDLLGSAAPLSGDFDNIFDDDEDPMAPVVSAPSLSDHASLNPLLGSNGGSSGLGIDDGLGLSPGGGTSAESVLSSPQQQRSSISRQSSSASATVASAPLPLMAGSSVTPDTAHPAGGSPGSNGRRRTSTSTVPEEMTAGWQNDEKDKDFRKQLIYQIANLLRERKTDPSDKWLKELPFKARKLEEQLYKKAPSLKAYLDPTTLKTRLKKVAHAITSQFREARDAKNKTGGGSRRGSAADIAQLRNSGGRSSMRDSMSSIGSLPSVSGADLTGGLGGGVSTGGFDQQQQQQAQVNASLQEQMYENIRQQQRIYDNLLQTNPQLAQMAGFSQGDQLLQARLQGMMGNSTTAAAGMNGMASLGQMNAAAGGMQNPLAAQAALMQSAGLGGAMAQNSLTAANQMAMMNQQALLRNSFTGTSGLSAMQAAMLGQSTTGGAAGTAGLASMLPPPPLTGAGLNATSAAGINPSMPPPSAGQSRTSSFVGTRAAHQLANAGGTQSRSSSFTAPAVGAASRGNSFSNGAGGGPANGGNNGSSGGGASSNNESQPSLSNEDLSLSPNSFKW